MRTATNNFKHVIELLRFENPLDFFFLQIIRRRKDKGNEDLPKHQKVIKDFYITSETQLTGLHNEITTLCDDNNARAMIRLNKRNIGVCAIYSQKEYLDKKINAIEAGELTLKSVDFVRDFITNSPATTPQMSVIESVGYIMENMSEEALDEAKDMRELKHILAKVIGSKPATNKHTHRWIVDVDSVDVEFQVKVRDTVQHVLDKMAEKEKHSKKIICTIPSRDGIHIITNRFDLHLFNTLIELQFGLKVDVQKDSTTNLYIR